MNKIICLLLIAVVAINAEKLHVGDFSSQVPMYAAEEEDYRVTHECVHDQAEDFVTIGRDLAEDEIEELTEDEMMQRQLVERRPARITYSWEQRGHMNSQQLVYMNKVMDVMTLLYSKFIYIVPRWSNLEMWISWCGDVRVPREHYWFNTGIPNSDIHIYATTANQWWSGWVARAGACQVQWGYWMHFSGIYMQFNMAMIGRMMRYRDQHRQFEEIVDVAIHELAHGLGFSGQYVQWWLDPYYWNWYRYGQTWRMHYVRRLLYVRRMYQYAVNTPMITRMARTYFGCWYAYGGQLENQGGSGTLGAHWERNVYGNEMMTGMIQSGDASLSKHTLALFYDTGFYDVQMNWGDNFIFGMHKGCIFLYYPCYYLVAYSFIREYKYQWVYGCDYRTQGFGQTMSYYGGWDCIYYGDYLTVSYDPYEHLTCNNAITHHSGVLAMTYDTGSAYNHKSSCFNGRMRRRRNNMRWDYIYRCHEARCNRWGNRVVIKVGGLRLRCIYNYQYIWAPRGWYGFMRCPESIYEFCRKQVSCPNWCSSNGACHGNECQCLEGYAGDACDEAAEGYYFDDEGNLRKMKDCAAGSYYSLDVHDCAACSEECATCFDIGADSCLSCAEGYNMNDRNECENRGIENCRTRRNHRFTASYEYTEGSCKWTFTGHAKLVEDSSRVDIFHLGWTFFHDITVSGGASCTPLPPKLHSKFNSVQWLREVDCKEIDTDFTLTGELDHTFNHSFHHCQCQVKSEHLDPWYEFCLRGCDDNDYCGRHNYFCGWMDENGENKHVTECRCKSVAGREAWDAYCKNGPNACSGESVCRNNSYFCEWH